MEYELLAVSLAPGYRRTLKKIAACLVINPQRTDIDG